MRSKPKSWRGCDRWHGFIKTLRRQHRLDLRTSTRFLKRCYHESGHGVAAHSLGYRVDWVFVIPPESFMDMELFSPTFPTAKLVGGCRINIWFIGTSAAFGLEQVRRWTCLLSAGAAATFIAAGVKPRADRYPKQAWSDRQRARQMIWDRLGRDYTPKDERDSMAEAMSILDDPAAWERVQRLVNHFVGRPRLPEIRERDFYKLLDNN